MRCALSDMRVASLLELPSPLWGWFSFILWPAFISRMTLGKKPQNFICFNWSGLTCFYSSTISSCTISFLHKLVSINAASFKFSIKCYCREIKNLSLECYVSIFEKLSPTLLSSFPTASHRTIVRKLMPKH